MIAFIYLSLPLYIFFPSSVFFSFPCIRFLLPYKMFCWSLLRALFRKRVYFILFKYNHRTRPKSSAKLLQNFELCKFFGKKIFQQFRKVAQNKNANRLFSAIYILEKHQKLSKIKSFQQSPVELFNKPQLSTLPYNSIFLQDTAFLGHMQGFSKISASYFT